ncbi:MAG: hypothetical protein F4202_02390 [Cenarchaeum sp. SB0677_bin_16]|nr:hypothetical protein [Cenarchaeum sp. SB0662_bin_33]MYG32834.1 hypothetical protein [Cenarchaeum sp. SB0677_bin_16]MYI51855.1 hypothetical protein [Cenarchaeum sp. SB0673_bin_9]
MQERVEGIEGAEVGVSGVRTIKMPKSEIGQSMARKYTDKAIYFTLRDAGRAGTDFRLVGKNVFRPGTERPKPDEFLPDNDVVMEIFHDLKQRLPP